MSFFLGKDSFSNLNPLAIPFTIRTDQQKVQTHEKTPAQLVLFEPRNCPSRERSCQTIYQRLHHRPREDWDANEPSEYE
jgi:hypothetical protein